MLFFAPMENLADRPLRRAFARSIGGCDELCSEFLRCPDHWSNPDKSRQITRGIAKKHDAFETAEFGMPLAAQVMGSNPEILEAVARLMSESGAPRCDLNMGCPANVVTGKGAGSSMLRDPQTVFEGCTAIVRGTQGTPALPTAKMRAGFTDTGLFDDNLAAVEASGIKVLTIHPRTKVQRYEGSADWALIARARARLSKTAVIGNGDVTTPARARALVQQAGVHGLMIGRGALRDPLIFWRVRSHFGDTLSPRGEALMAEEGRAVGAFLRAFDAEVVAMNPRSSRTRVNRMKQVCSYLFTHNRELEDTLPLILRIPSNQADADRFTEECVRLVERHWRPGPSWSSRLKIQGMQPVLDESEPGPESEPEYRGQSGGAEARQPGLLGKPVLVPSASAFNAGASPGLSYASVGAESKGEPGQGGCAGDPEVPCAVDFGSGSETGGGEGCDEEEGCAGGLWGDDEGGEGGGGMPSVPSPGETDGTGGPGEGCGGEDEPSPLDFGEGSETGGGEEDGLGETYIGSGGPGEGCGGEDEPCPLDFGDSDASDLESNLEPALESEVAAAISSDSGPRR